MKNFKITSKRGMAYSTIYLIIVMALCACAGQKSVNDGVSQIEDGTETYVFRDSCEHLNLCLSLELPIGTNSVSSLIRDSLIADFMRSAGKPGYGDDETPDIKPFEGDKEDVQALVDYYGKAGYERLLKMAMSDYEERTKYLEEDTSMSEENKEMIMKDIPQWAFDLNISKLIDTLDFVVYNSQIYCYYGGAHGGVTGTGDLTFDKSSGKKIGRFLRDDAIKALQPLLRKGLRDYYSFAGDPVTDKQLSERLQIVGVLVPLPQRAAMPNSSGDSLVLTYGQYEIACYADGMPSFTIAVKDLMPYLTEEGKALLEKAARKSESKNSDTI